MKKLLLTTAMLGALVGYNGAASATDLTLADIGGSGTGTFNGLIGGTILVPELGASLTLTLDSVDTANNTWNFSYSITNTTQSPWSSSVSAFGFNTDPTLTGVGATGLFGNALMNVNVSGGIGQVDFCDSTGPTCNGGASNGVDPGITATGTFFLDFAGMADATTHVMLTDYFDRYQEINGPGVTGQSGVGFGSDLVINPVIAPVPGPIVGAGLPGIVAGCMFMLGLGKYRRRRNLNLA